MKCPFCNNLDTQVVDSRVSEDGNTIRRRRRCGKCERRFTTYERVDLQMPTIVKRNGTRAEFDLSKLRSSMEMALRKRPVSTIALDDSLARIQEKILLSGDREIDSRQIGELVMNELLQLDQVAYIRFSSVYKSFEDIGEFINAIHEMQTP